MEFEAEGFTGPHGHSKWDPDRDDIIKERQSDFKMVDNHEEIMMKIWHSCLFYVLSLRVSV